jgi:hypothetical protein
VKPVAGLIMTGNTIVFIGVCEHVVVKFHPGFPGIGIVTVFAGIAELIVEIIRWLLVTAYAIIDHFFSQKCVFKTAQYRCRINSFMICMTIRTGLICQFFVEEPFITAIGI